MKHGCGKLRSGMNCKVGLLKNYFTKSTFFRKVTELEDELKNVSNNLKSLEAQADKVRNKTLIQFRCIFSLQSGV